jgi:hypothetical protein
MDKGRIGDPPSSRSAHGGQNPEEEVKLPPGLDQTAQGKPNAQRETTQENDPPRSKAIYHPSYEGPDQMMQNQEKGITTCSYRTTPMKFLQKGNKKD